MGVRRSENTFEGESQIYSNFPASAKEQIGDYEQIIIDNLPPIGVHQPTGRYPSINVSVGSDVFRPGQRFPSGEELPGLAIPGVSGPGWLTDVIAARSRATVPPPPPTRTATIPKKIIKPPNIPTAPPSVSRSSPSLKPGTRPGGPAPIVADERVIRLPTLPAINKENPVALDLGNLLGNLVDVVGSVFRAEARGPTVAPVMGPQQFFNTSSPPPPYQPGVNVMAAGLGIPGVEVIQESNLDKGLVYKKVCGEYRWVKQKRRRRKKLLTDADFNALLRIQALKVNSNMTIAIAKAIGR